VVLQQLEIQAARHRELQQRMGEEEISFLKELMCGYQFGIVLAEKVETHGKEDELKREKGTGGPAFRRPAPGATASVSGAEFFRRGANKESTSNKDTANILATRIEERVPRT